MLIVNSFINLQQIYSLMENHSPLDTIIELNECTIMQGDHLVLTNVNLHIDRGEFIYLVGRVGSGKSSLIKTLNAQLPLSAGNGMVAGYDLASVRKREIPYLRRKLGVVFQDFQLLTDRNIIDNLGFALRATGWKNRKDIDLRIAEVLDKTGLSRKGYKMPHQLSGGEQQRVVIARALLNNPDIILADEPTGNLDPETSEGIISLLVDISRNGRAVIVATHNYNIIKKFPARTFVCDNGKLSEKKGEEEIELL